MAGRRSSPTYEKLRIRPANWTSRTLRILKKSGSISWYTWIGAVVGAIIATPLFGCLVQMKK